MELGSFEITLIAAAVLASIVWTREAVKYVKHRHDAKRKEVTFSKLLILLILSLVCAKAFTFTILNLLPIAQGLSEDEDIKILLVLGGLVALALTVYSLFRASNAKW